VSIWFARVVVALKLRCYGIEMRLRDIEQMRYHVLASDYNGTLARDCVVNPETIEALGRLRDSGRKLILVTGRELPDLERAFPKLDLFQRVVAENGALLYDPQSRSKRRLAQRPAR